MAHRTPYIPGCDFRVPCAWAESGQGDLTFSVALLGRPVHNLEDSLGGYMWLVSKMAFPA